MGHTHTHEMSKKWAEKNRNQKKTFSWYNQFSSAGKFGSGAIMNRMADKINQKNKIYLNHEVSSFKYKDNNILKMDLKKLKMKQSYLSQ